MSQYMNRNWLRAVFNIMLDTDGDKSYKSDYEWSGALWANIIDLYPNDRCMYN